jgi:hypothetical protein
VLLAVAGTRVVLTRDPIVVGVEPVRIATRAAVLEEEDLRRPLRAKVLAVLVSVCGCRRGQRIYQQNSKNSDSSSGEKPES